MWKAQRFLYEISSNWGNAVSSIQSLRVLLLQTCVSPLLSEPACPLPAYGRVVCSYQLASCSCWRYQAGFFCSLRLTKVLARAPSGPAPVLLPLSPFSVPNGKLQGLWAGDAMESQALTSTENKNNFLPWTTGETFPGLFCTSGVGQKQAALSGADAADTQWLDYECLSWRQDRQSQPLDF